MARRSWMSPGIRSVNSGDEQYSRSLVLHDSRSHSLFNEAAAFAMNSATFSGWEIIGT